VLCEEAAGTELKGGKAVLDLCYVISGLIDKAKSKLANVSKTEDSIIRTTPKYYDIYEDVAVGRTSSHFEYFKRIRSSQVERLSSEASKLLIRLHKIVSFEGEDFSKRRG